MGSLQHQSADGGQVRVIFFKPDFYWTKAIGKKKNKKNAFDTAFCKSCLFDWLKYRL